MADYWYDHIHLMSPDPVKTSKFYEGMFNAKRIATREIVPGKVTVEISLNGCRILISQGEQTDLAESSSGDQALHHFGILTDDIGAAITNLKSYGVPIQQDITEVRPGIKIAFIMAPDNVVIEMMERKADK